MITEKDIVYISGPMTGIADYNRAAFNDAEKKIRERYGCATINPADLPDGWTWERYMEVNLENMEKATAIVHLPGWEKSRGATIEHSRAMEKNLLSLLFIVLTVRTACDIV